MNDEQGTVAEQPVKRIAVIGAGTQGSQITFRCAAAGYKVLPFDASRQALDRAIQRIPDWLEQYVAAGKLSGEQVDALPARVQPSSSLAEAVREAGLVIEAVPEKLELKREVWAQIDAAAPPHALLTTNSSSIRSSLLSSHTSRADRTFNVNFTFPVEDDLVEVMWNPATSEETKSAARSFLASLGMIVLETRKEIQGFSFNRVWRAIKKECLHLWGKGNCDPGELDRHFTLVLGTEMGPFALMDKIGLDVVRDIELSYYHETGDPSDRPPQALEDLIEQGHLGVKTGRGFYEYPS